VIEKVFTGACSQPNKRRQPLSFARNSKGQVVEACEGDGEIADFAGIGFRNVGGDDEVFSRRME
jgi:hypothetical protein